MHLRSHDVDFAAARNHFLNHIAVVFRHYVVVDIKFHFFREVLLRRLERIEHEVGGHDYPEARFHQLVAVFKAALGVGFGRLVDNVPAVYGVAVVFGDFNYAFFERLFEVLREHGEHLGEVFAREFFVVFRVLFGLRAHAEFWQFCDDVAHENLALLRVRQAGVEQPSGNVEKPDVPNERVPVYADSHLFAEFDDVFGSGATPVRLGFGGFRFRPEFLSVPVFGVEARASLLHFEGIPVERHRCGIEERAVESLVLCVEGGVAELVEVEDVRAEDEVVRNLLYDNLRAVLDLPDVYDGVRLAVRLDVGVDSLLEFWIPDVPILLGHDVACILRGVLRDFYVACERSKCG